MSSEQIGQSAGVRREQVAPAVDLEYALRSAGIRGVIETTGHFVMRSTSRHFTVIEALHILRSGVIKSGPDFIADFCNWRYVVLGPHDRGDLHIVAAVSAGEPVDYPRVVLVTGFIR